MLNNLNHTLCLMQAYNASQSHIAESCKGKIKYSIFSPNSKTLT